MACLGDETIAAYVDGALDHDALARVNGHIDSCVACRTQLSAVAAAPVMHSFVTEVPTSLERDSTVDITTALAEGIAGYPLPEFQIGRYIVESVIGRGAMGLVLRARDPELDRAIAIKLVAPALRRGSLGATDSGTWRARLRAEARAMAKL